MTRELTAWRLLWLTIVLVAGDAALLLRVPQLPNFLAAAAGIASATLLIPLTLTEFPTLRSGAQRLTGLLSDEGWLTAGVFLVFLAFYAACAGRLEASPYNAHVRQAYAFLHGHTYIDAPYYIEHAVWKGHSYQLHPPLPAILLMPLVAIWGMGTNQTAFSILMGALDVALAWRLLGRFRLNMNARLWLTVFFGAGTILWYESIIGSSWAVSMVVAVTFTLAALDEAFGEARPLRLGILSGLAALSRYDLAFDWPIYVVLAWHRGRRVSELKWMLGGYVLATAIFVGLNEARYQSLFDRGVFLFAPKGTVLFGLRYLPGNIYTLLFMAPKLTSHFPYIRPRFVGQSLVTTSPGFILALRPSFRRLMPCLMGVAALIAMTPSLFYFTNGFAQFGTRHYLHAFPFLLVMMALGLRRRADQLTRILVASSVVLIAYGVWCTATYGLAG